MSDKKLYTTVRIPVSLHERIKERAREEQRTVTVIAERALAAYFTEPSESRSLVRVSECPIPEPLPAVIEQRASAVALEARRMVQGNVPRHLLSNSRVRAGLEEQVRQMMKDECDPRGIVLALQEWANRPDAYPGHLPHIYTELLKARTARPKSTVTDKVAGWLELGEQMTGEGR